MLDPRTRTPWMMVLVSALLLEAIALYFQFGMNLDPCVLCVYQRAAVLGVAVGGLVGVLHPRQRILRLAAYLTIAGSAVMGLRFALRHVAVLRGESLDCSFMPDFPTWLPLHEWFPFLFRPTGMCDEIDWYFLGLSMPEVMVGVFAAYLISLVYGVVGEFSSLHRPTGT